MKRIHFHNGHRDLIGGGQLACYHLAVALQSLFHVTLSTTFHEGMWSFEHMRKPAHPWEIVGPEGPSECDVFLACDYTNLPPAPQSVDTRIVYVFFPRHAHNIDTYSHALPISQYAREWTDRRWQLPVLEPLVGGVFADDWYPIYPKSKAILSCSRFFCEGDPSIPHGHTKGQHYVLRAFLEADPEDWELWLAGSVLHDEDQAYLNRLAEIADGDERVRFFPNAKLEEVQDLYGRAMVFAHAMGMDRPDPAETEHHGFCVERALICGLECLCHDSGGAALLAHDTFTTESQLAELLVQVCQHLNVDDCFRTAREHEGRTWEAFEEKVEEVFGRWT